MARLECKSYGIPEPIDFPDNGESDDDVPLFWARIEIETDRDISDDLPTAASGALMARCQETRSSARNSQDWRITAKKLAAGIL